MHAFAAKLSPCFADLGKQNIVMGLLFDSQTHANENTVRYCSFKSEVAHVDINLPQQMKFSEL